MGHSTNVLHSAFTRRGAEPVIQVTPRLARWHYTHFMVHKLIGRRTCESATAGLEVCLLLLSGKCEIRWSDEQATLGPRDDVFGSYPHAVYLPRDTRFRVTPAPECELAVCGAPTRRHLSARVIEPSDCGYEIRGGGNATRQIIDVIRPDFPADRLLVVEVFTPGGNWSSYPPHKHDVQDSPHEVKLEEVYYYRFRDRSCGYGFQRLYRSGGRQDETILVKHGDVTLVRSGYHPFVAAHGYDAYYLNVLAGSRRSMAASDDPRYAHLRKAWPEPDPRVPMVPVPAGVARVF
jgi:5-deoxy-glucuronate isomerase